MNTRIYLLKPKTRLTASTAISLLFHGTLLVFLQIFLAHQKHEPNKSASPLQVKLSPYPSPRIQFENEKKLITIKSPSTLKMPASTVGRAESPVKQPDISSNPNQTEEKIAGISFPRAMPSPFSNFQVQGNDFFVHHNAEMTANALHQQMAMQNMDRTQRELEAKAKLKQLEILLRQITASHPDLSGQCRLIEKPTNQAQLLQCDNPSLQILITPHQHQIETFLSASLQTSQQRNGFIIQSDSNLIILNYFNSLPQ